jgi:predicted DsbA family dithiol-disulfide isomerase
MDFPLARHKNAFAASRAGLCARDQGKFWEMNARLFSNPVNNPMWLEREHIVQLAEVIGLDMATFTMCLDSGKHDGEIRRRIAEGKGKAGITGTPAFLLGTMTSDGKVRSVKKIVGALPFAAFKAAIDDVLASKRR